MPTPKEDRNSQSSSNLLSFFSVVNRDPGPGVRRRLTLKTPPARKKPSTAGRTNPLPAPEHSETSQRMRRLRPHSIATTRLPIQSKTVVARPGERERREENLTVEDLWRPGKTGAICVYIFYPIRFSTPVAMDTATYAPGYGWNGSGAAQIAIMS
ncbi:hypothetical protein C8F04DRAFT_1269374 [Mycena alexandri]|uniref:Uncharacterized protein n=1 Tax=Mycena alexandri TaxID=1745969 RepID=A0AAD6WSA6_9AGAR|nr:hypothetical protein C8F04DRAFT_1269374 [Mycena alexandri]